MEHRLEVDLDLSGPLRDSPAAEARARAVAQESVDRTIGTRGSGKLADWRLADSKISVVFESEGPRPHQTLLAFVRRLSVELGKNQKVGIRSFHAVRYQTTFSVESAPKANVSLPLPHSLSFEGTKANLELTDIPEEGLRDNWMDRVVALVQEKVRRQSYTGKEQFWELLRAPKPRSHEFKLDPTEEMLRRNWVRSGPTKGKWFLGPQAAHLLRAMERIAIQEVLAPLGFQEVVQPHHDSFETLIKTGHLEGLPGELYYVSEPKSRDPAEWETFTDLVKITRRLPADELARRTTRPVAVSNYAQCPTIYWWLSGRTLATDALPLKVFDRAAVSNRYESGGRHGLERVDEFHRIEPVFIGTPEQLLTLRESILERYAYVFDEVLELEWRTAWVTPFYLQQAGGVGVEDAAERVKGTIDFEAFLPYRGDREKVEWLEFQNLSIVGDKYTKAFTIRTQKGELWSGCTGIGLERWLVSFLAQKGFEPADWPAKFRDATGSLPRDVHYL